MKLLLLSFLLGLLSACGFEPLRLWPLTILAFAGLLWLLGTAPSLKSALARGYWFGFGQFVLGLNWIATCLHYQAAMPAWLGWIAVVALSFYSPSTRQQVPDWPGNIQHPGTRRRRQAA
jgi:apolipoprotein N-acyltransferase